jgi:hypothetical protein
MTRLLTFVLALFIGFTTFAQSLTYSSDSSDIKLTGVVELGYLAVADHKVQFSNSGTYFDYVADGGQNVLFPISRLSLEFEFKKKNTFYLLYQPLRLETQVLLQEDLIVDDLTFPANTGVDLLYNFPFYRLSYTRELLSGKKNYGLAIGATLQLRNATISFESLDGTRFRTNRDLGVVPAFKVKSHAYLGERVFAELEADGIYAPISYLNGSDNEVVGAILDASLRVGMEFEEPITAFLNFRYLGGGAVGTSDIDGPGDGYVRNWLNFLTLTAGFRYELAW